MSNLDLLNFPFIEILDPIVLSDRRILVLYLYKLLTNYSNVSYHDKRLWIDGCACMLRSAGSKINFHPSYQKGHGREESDEGFERLKSSVDFFVVVKKVKNGVVLVPVSSNGLTDSKKSVEDICQV